MRRITACIFMTIVMVVSLCACGGMGDKKCSPGLSSPFTVSADIEYDDNAYAAVFTRRDVNNWEVEFSAPDNLSGIILTFKNNNVEASYNGLSFSVPKTALPLKSMIAAFIDVSEKAAEKGELTGEQKEEELAVSGETELGKYILKFDKNSSLSGFEMDNLKLKMTFTDFRVISGNMAEKPTAEIEDMTEVTVATAEEETTDVTADSTEASEVTAETETERTETETTE